MPLSNIEKCWKGKCQSVGVLPRQRSLIFMALAGLFLFVFYNYEALIGPSSALTKAEQMHVLILFSKAERNVQLRSKFATCLTSMLEHRRLESPTITLHILGDKWSGSFAKNDVFGKLDEKMRKKVRVELHNVEEAAAVVEEKFGTLLRHFRYKPGAYYGDNLFFVSTILFELAQFQGLDRVVMLDSDLKFNADVGQLWDFFERFGQSQMIGAAREMQPVYRHVFRTRHSGTKIGDPPPEGVTGFNSGVLLLDLKKIRASKTYINLLNADAIESLVERYHFRGTLGDQDFYTLISTEYMGLFYTLPCSWNRQLCQWWRNHGYGDVFDQYFTCDEPKVNVFHGNCDTAFPTSH